MRNKFLNVIGLMSGTSIDGIDVSYVKSDGFTIDNIKNYFYEYKKKDRKKLELILKNHLQILNDKSKLLECNKYVSELHINALKDFFCFKEVDLIGFHGQTIYHNPYLKTSVQLGDPLILAKTFKKNIVYSFRSFDIQRGGQGAPLAPIYHKCLMEKFNFRLPSCFLNIGGISNLTYWDGIDLIGFDIGPGNCLLDDYMKKIKNKNFDENGHLASKGNIDQKLVNYFLNDPYFRQIPPKSLDREYFKPYLLKVIKKINSSHNAMATLLEFTFQSILHSINSLPNELNNIFLCGGGKKNKFLVEKIKNHYSNIKIIDDFNGLDSDFIESEMIAYLATRSFYLMPITFPKTTGVVGPTTGGKIYKNPT